mmetsp:Transcript_88082/g.196941  ORF Transcript_88082/g.196941 Transcript_88082/m.196941 type:complete len:203 (-) Transcript_88082:156-764(-)
MGAQCCCTPIENTGSETTLTVASNEDFVTAEALVDELVRHSGKDHQKGEKHVRVSVELIETILLQEEGETQAPQVGFKRVSERKSTGFVSKANVADAANTVRLSLPPQDISPAPADVAERASRVKDRKGTGFVTKEKLLHMLDEISDDEEDLDATEIEQKAAAAKVVAKSSKERCKERKGTGFVTKNKLKKVLAAVGEDEDD